MRSAVHMHAHVHYKGKLTQASVTAATTVLNLGALQVLSWSCMLAALHMWQTSQASRVRQVREMRVPENMHAPVSQKKIQDNTVQ